MKEHDNAEFITVDLKPWRERMQNFYKTLITEGVMTQELFDSAQALGK
jgi:hypothetical protein